MVGLAYRRLVVTMALGSVLLVAACSGESDGVRDDDPGYEGRVDTCDLRALFGTCVEYSLSELGDWYRDHVEHACLKNRRGELFGVYRKDSHCPAEDRVARCEGMIEDPAERYEYDKHYYTGTAEGYAWETTNVKVTCENVSGRFVPE